MGCIHYWSSPFQVGSHHLARQFVAAGWRVAYLSAPVTPLHLLRWNDSEVRERVRLYLQPAISEGEDSLIATVPGALLAPDNRPLLGSSWVCRHWPSLTLPSLRAFLSRHGFANPDLLYLENPYHAGLTRCVRARISCYHMADDYSAFPGHTAGLRATEAELCRDADLLVLPSAGLQTVAQGFGRSDALVVPNGVDFRHFARSRDECARPDLYRSLTGPIVVYVGAFDTWFDVGLMAELARRLDNVSFVLIGPGTAVARQLSGIANVHLVGPINREELPRYLVHADAGIIPFDVTRHAQLLAPVRPLKLLEYLAAGLPVVSRSWPEIERMQAPITCADTADAFCEALSQTLSNPPPAQRLRDYAASHDWKAAFASLESAIEARLQVGPATR